MKPRVNLPADTIAEFCERHRIRRFAFFGSVIRDDFGPESDVDILIEFDPDARVGFLSLAGMEIELSDLLNRRVEIHTVRGLHPRYRDEILSEAEFQFEQAAVSPLSV
ncbi:MAG: nucleotidyltransferase family protein [Deltaproteobacteria bacterium]|nr:nucleotidyltransferase family protein [Deltaproteobacteria bacterium]